MKTIHPLRTLAMLIALLATPLLGHAQTTTGTATPTVGTSTNVTQKLTDQFTSFAGSPENSNALVNGLRTGSSITLTSSPPAGSPTGTLPTTTTFTPPTKPMGYGNVRIAMSLAQAQLAQQGITNPTPEQLQGALMGTSTTVNGVTTQTQGVLQMRADGMGWGKIANTMGFKLGAVMSGKATVPTTAAGTASTTGSKVTNAAGNSAGANAANRGSKGIVTASGTSAGGTANANRGNAYGHANKGIVTAAGTSANAGAGGVNAMGHGAAGAKGGVVAGAGGGHGGGNAKGHGKP